MYASTVYMYMRYTNAITLSSLSRGCSLPYHAPSPLATLPAQITSKFCGRGCCVRVSAATWRRHSAPPHSNHSLNLYVSPPPSLSSSANLSLPLSLRCSLEPFKFYLLSWKSQKLSPGIALAFPFHFPLPFPSIHFWHSRQLCKFFGAIGNAWRKCFF